MMADAHQRITLRHLQRQAMLYVRQSSLHQVLENTESTARQYALRERAIALGWPTEQIVVIDQALGQSGASAVDRAGFQRLVAEVGLGQVGLVMGLEVSRLARSSLDWHHLLEICAMTHELRNEVVEELIPSVGNESCAELNVECGQGSRNRGRENEKGRK